MKFPKSMLLLAAANLVSLQAASVYACQNDYDLLNQNQTLVGALPLVR